MVYKMVETIVKKSIHINLCPQDIRVCVCVLAPRCGLAKKRNGNGNRAGQMRPGQDQC